MSKTVKEVSIKIDKYIKDGKDKFNYLKIGVAFIGENGTLTGIGLKSFASDLLANAEIKEMNTRNGLLMLQVFQDKDEGKAVPHFVNQLESDTIPF